MRRAGLPEIVVRTFAYYFEQLLSGETGLIPESEIEPVTALPDVEAFPESLAESGHKALKRTVLLKLNGGLGTTMGLDKAKSLLEVKEGLSFLDIIARQALHAGVPLILMNSFRTHADSLAALAVYPELKGELPLDFVQHKVPKIDQRTLSPVSWPEDPALEWNPPGHGDIYTALVTSGMLERLLAAGYEYAFVSNADNLGAVIDATILGYFVEERIPFLMECADRTENDRKGGHLARRKDGRLILRESAQCPPEDADAFQDIRRHRYFNTNNLWLNLRALQEVMAARDNILGLPMIRNRKHVDPRRLDSTPVYQLETAMGAAIALFPGAQAIRVPRTRFAPVKSTADLLAVRSDAYVLTADYRLVLHPDRHTPPPSIHLDPDYYRLIAQLEARFPFGPPSLRLCTSLRVEGDFRFGRGVVCEGAVHLQNRLGRQVHIPDHSRLQGVHTFQPEYAGQ
ncbi:MAG: UTP--glucose-1-phosphate uridylyltransferase [Caldilineae bacterium]|nr:MAG: UTP--glucose-1-phosphate uridylyltransferase [Caldilineae bacterium]